MQSGACQNVLLGHPLCFGEYINVWCMPLFSWPCDDLAKAASVDSTAAGYHPDANSPLSIPWQQRKHNTDKLDAIDLKHITVTQSATMRLITFSYLLSMEKKKENMYHSVSGLAQASYGRSCSVGCQYSSSSTDALIFFFFGIVLTFVQPTGSWGNSDQAPRRGNGYVLNASVWDRDDSLVLKGTFAIAFSEQRLGLCDWKRVSSNRTTVPWRHWWTLELGP